MNCPKCQDEITYVYDSIYGKLYVCSKCRLIVHWVQYTPQTLKQVENYTDKMEQEQMLIKALYAR